MISGFKVVRYRPKKSSAGFTLGFRRINGQNTAV
jgi:hypothetical protein